MSTQQDGTGHDLRDELLGVQLQLARLSGLVETVVAAVQSASQAQAGLETRIRACELQCAGCVSAQAQEHRPAQWPAAVAALMAAAALLWQIAQQVGAS